MHLHLFLAMQCLPPTLPTHASKTAKESPYYYGEIIHFGCEHGYNLNGPGTLKCIVNGSLQEAVWSYESQTCEGIRSSLLRRIDLLVAISKT